MAQLVKLLTAQAWGHQFGSLSPTQKLRTAACLLPQPCGGRSGDRQIPGAHWIARLGESAAPGSVTLSLNNKIGSDKETHCILFWPPNYILHAFVNVHSIHTYIFLPDFFPPFSIK